MAKILLVEDDNNLREIFEMRLKAEGYNIVTAHDGEQALVVAMQEKPDLVISDVMMPKLSGFEMIETLKAAPDMKNVKVIMMTALGQAEDRSQGDRLGVDKYLVKSQVTLEDFVRVTKEVLEGPAATPPPPPIDPSAGPESPSDIPPSIPPAVPPTEPPSPPATPPEGTPPVAPPPQPPLPPPPPVVPPPPPPVPTAPPSSVVSPISEPSNEPLSPSSPPPPAPTEPLPPEAGVALTAPTDTTENQPSTPQLPELPAEQMFAPAPTTPQSSPVISPFTGTSQAEELASVEKQINDFVATNPTLADLEAPEPPSQPAPALAPSDEPPSPPIQLPVNPATPSETSSNPTPNPTPATATPVVDSPSALTNRQKIIQPLNDPTKGPDLEAMLAKEEENDQAREILKQTLAQAEAKAAQSQPPTAVGLPSSAPAIPQVAISPTGEVLPAQVPAEVPIIQAPPSPNDNPHLPPGVDPHSIAL